MKLLFFNFFFAVFVLSFLAQAALAKDILLNIGESYRLSVGKQSSIQVGSGKILRVIDNMDHLTLIGKAKGSTYLRNGSKTYQIHVLEKNDKDFFVEAQKLFQHLRGLNLDIKKGEIQITGQLLALQDWIDISELSMIYQASYMFKPTLSKELQMMAKQYWQKHDLLGEAISIAWKPHPHLEYSDSRDKKPNNKLQSFGLGLKKSSGLLKLGAPIKLQIVIAEVSRSISSDIGIDWPATANVELSPSLKGPSSLQVVLNAAVSKGEARILASPVLLARSGGEAEFLAGGEFPIRQASRYGDSITWKRHGIYMKFKPLTDRTRQLKLEMSTEISMLDEGLSVDNIPAMKTNRISSQFDLKKPRTVVLSGLIKNTQGHTQAGLPGLQDIPILGQLFGSQKFRQHKTELIIFVSPQIMNWDKNGS